MVKDRSAFVLRANVLLVMIGLADLITTLFWLATGQATEVNPIMAAVLATSLVLFIFVKVATLGAYVATIEWYRRHRNASFARLVSRVTLIAYVGVYTVSFAAVNADVLLR